MSPSFKNKKRGQDSMKAQLKIGIAFLIAAVIYGFVTTCQGL
jgi:hypothetical protein